jgi:protein ImuA
MTSLADVLSRHPAHLWVGTRGRMEVARLSTGHAALDAALEGGWPRGTLIELLACGPGLGRLALLLPALAALSRDGHIAWLAEAPYAPALARAGVGLDHVLVVDTADKRRCLWAAERCLKSGACDALVMEEDGRLADPLLRRLKLAAAGNDAIAFLLRKSATAATASPAGLRLLVAGLPHSGTRRITVLKHGAAPARTIILDSHAGH